MNRSASHVDGFTLLELVLVLVVLSVALAMAAPSMQGWSRGSKQRDAAENFLAVTRWARTQAAADARLYRLNIDEQAGKYFLTVQDGQQLVPLGKSMGQEFEVPEGNRIEVKDLAGQQLQFLDFYPTGRAQPAIVRITSTHDGRVIQLESLSPAEPFRQAVNPQEQVR